jgi:hypothetical protein
MISLSWVLFLMIVVVFVALAVLDGCTAHASCPSACANDMPSPREYGIWKWRMTDATSSAFSSASLVEDIVRLIAPTDRKGFQEMLQHELRIREPLPDHELRRIAINTWHQFCKHGWPRA